MVRDIHGLLVDYHIRLAHSEKLETRHGADGAVDGLCVLEVLGTKKSVELNSSALRADFLFHAEFFVASRLVEGVLFF